MVTYIIAKHREDREKKDKEETRIKEEVDAKTNHTANEVFHYIPVMKQEIKEVILIFKKYK